MVSPVRLFAIPIWPTKLKRAAKSPFGTSLFVFGILLVGSVQADDDELKLYSRFRRQFVSAPPVDESSDAEQTEPCFLISKFETTQEIYTAVMGDNPSRWRGERNAVDSVSYDRAVEFCSRATEQLRERQLLKDEEELRLPTDGQWRFAAAAGSKGRYCWGDDPQELSEYGWFTGNAAGNDPPVGEKRQNRWDLYDVHGYLWEWTQASEKDVETAPLRGGSWRSDVEECSLDAVQIVDRGIRRDDVGFRCVIVEIEGAENAP